MSKSLKIDLKPVLGAVDPAEAIAFFQQKGYRIGFDHHDVWQQEHQAAFTVAKAMQMSLLSEFKAAVDEVLAKGGTQADFNAMITPRLIERGWWGKQEMVDPATGEAELVQLGSPRRLQVIYETNLATAYAEGQTERIKANTKLFPFLLYDGLNSIHPRDSHRPWDGMVLRADDPWWDSHMPIKEYGCKCTAIQLTSAMMERNGYAISKAPPEVMRTVVNKRTDEEMQVPVGVDPAFNYPHGGRRANLARFMMDTANTTSARIGAQVLRNGATTWMPALQSGFGEFVGRYVRGERQEAGRSYPVGALTPAMVGALEAAGAPIGSAVVMGNLNKLSHLLGDNRGEARKAKGSGEVFVATLPTLLTQVGEAWLDGGALVLLCSAPDEVKRVVKVVVRMDVKGNRKTDVLSNSVVSMELIDPKSFKRSGLKNVLK